MFIAILLAVLLIVGVLLYRASYLAIAAKGGFGALLCFWLYCFGSGLMNGFHFYHAASPPGFEAGMAMILFFGLAMGPIILICCGLITVAVVYAKRKMEKK